MHRRPLRDPFRAAATAAVLGVLGVLCALVVSGCASSSSAASPPSTTETTATTGTTATTPGTSTTAGGGFAAYRTCLQQHGVTLPQGGFFRRGAARNGSTTTTPGGAGPGGSRRPAPTPAEQKAQQACASLRPQGGFGDRGFGANNPAFAKFQACLKAHGLQLGGGADRTSPSFRSGFAVCRSVLPAGAGAGGGGFGGGGFGGGFGGGGAGSSSANPAFARFQACLKAHGVNAGGGQPSAKTQAAIAACRSVLPNSGNGSGSATTTTTTG